MRKLNKGDRVGYNGSVYEVVAVIWSTLYLRKAKIKSDESCCNIEAVREIYKDIEFLESEE